MFCCELVSFSCTALSHGVRDSTLSVIMVFDVNGYQQKKVEACVGVTLVVFSKCLCTVSVLYCVCVICADFIVTFRPE